MLSYVGLDGFKRGFCLAAAAFITLIAYHVFSTQPMSIFLFHSSENSQDDLILPLQYSYVTPQNAQMTGTPFNVPTDVIHKLGHPPRQWTDILDTATLGDLEQADHLLFVTAASSNHFLESKHAVLGVQQYFPNHTLIYVDIGLRADQVDQVKQWCKTVYKRFHTEKYPNHVANVSNYAWKPLLMMEILLQYPDYGALFIDASIRFLSSSLKPLLEVAKSNGGFCGVVLPYYPVFPAVHPTMLEYLVTDIESLQSQNSMIAGFFLMYMTKPFYERFYWPLLLCMLDENCVAPFGSKKRCEPPFKKDVYANCHRFEQAAMNILLLNRFNFIREHFGVPWKINNNLFIVRRHEKMLLESPNFCNTSMKRTK